MNTQLTAPISNAKEMEIEHNEDGYVYVIDVYTNEVLGCGQTVLEALDDYATQQ